MALPNTCSSISRQSFNVLDREVVNKAAASISTNSSPQQMPGSFLGPGVSTSYYPPLINGELIDLTTPDAEVKISSLAMNVATFAAKTAITGASMVAAYGTQKLDDHDISTRVSEWLQKASEAAEDKIAEIDWVQIPIDVAKWISDNPNLAKSLGCVATTGALTYMPNRMPSVLWGYGMGVAGKTVAKAGLKHVIGIDPNKSMVGHFWSAVSGEYGDKVQKGLNKTGEIIWKLTKRKGKRAKRKRKPAARKRKP